MRCHLARTLPALLVSLAGPAAAAGDPVFIDGFAVEPPALSGITASQNVVRAGVGVAPLFWDERLAASAQSWVEQCVDVQAPAGLIDADPNRSVGYPWYVGENIFGSSGAVDVAAAVDLWASEAANYDYASNTCTGICSHYLQVVWSSSVRIGCGTFNCPRLTFGNSLVCNYGPGGASGQRPY